NRRRGLLDGHDAVVREQLAVRARLAVDVVLADERLRTDLAARARAERRDARLLDVRLDDGDVAAVGDLLEVEAGRLAGADAADLEVAAGRQPERVVELDLVRLAGAARARAGRARHDRDADGREDDQDACR